MTPLARYAEAFETVTPETLDRFRDLVTDDVRFRDPFNEVEGVEAFLRVFEQMYEDTDDPQFKVTRVVEGEPVGFITWDFTFRPKGKQDVWTVDGATEVHLTPSGKISAHLDHWDAGGQFYARLPVLGWMIKQVKRRMALR